MERRRDGDGEMERGSVTLGLTLESCCFTGLLMFFFQPDPICRENVPMYCGERRGEERRGEERSDTHSICKEVSVTFASLQYVEGSFFLAPPPLPLAPPPPPLAPPPPGGSPLQQ